MKTSGFECPPASPPLFSQVLIGPAPGPSPKTTMLPATVLVGNQRCVTYLAFATHSMVTSEVPATTLVFLGGMMMVGAMGSAGPPTSEKRSSIRRVESEIPSLPAQVVHGDFSPQSTE